MDQLKLFMILVGCKPPGRHTEQHDVFFSIGNDLKELVPQLQTFWKDSGEMHIDAWREVTTVDGHAVTIQPKASGTAAESTSKIFFLNLGGYKPGEFEEFHYKLLSVGPDKAAAIRTAKQTAFYKHTGFKGAESHVDDKYGIDVDDLYAVEDILPDAIKALYQIQLLPTNSPVLDEWHIGYTPLRKIK